jgi:5,10-methylenetetrahydromethanopterin reductase
VTPDERRPRSLEFATSGFYPAFTGATNAAASEAMGLDVHAFPENHSRVPDPFGEMRDAVARTSQIRLQSGPVNFVTRNPGVIASAILPLQILSQGRAICGVASGDSAVAAAGQAPQRIRAFERDLNILRAYLHGAEADLGGHPSRVVWTESFRFEPPPIEMACSGPRAIDLAARLADRVSLGLGAHPDRIAWALRIVDEALAKAGRDRDSIRVGMSVPLAITETRSEGKATIRTRVAPWAHMSSGKGINLSDQPEILRRVTSVLRHSYDYAYHHPAAPADNPNTAVCDEDFADWMGIGGPPPYALDRMGHLVEMGIDFFVIPLPRPELEVFAAEVIPALRSLRG